MMPFEIDVPYRMRPNLRLLGEDEPITYQDKQYEYYITEKKKSMCPVYGNNWTMPLRDSVLRYLQCDTIDQATTRYQEDFVVWAPNMKGELSIQMASVCFPSSWDPVEKVNKTFAEIHEPISDNEMIMAAADKIATMITQKGPFTRSGWFIHNSSELNRHPSVKKPWTNETINEMFYRCERQVTVPFNDHAIFFIRTYVAPLSSVDYNKLKESINTMSEETLTYKDMHHAKKVLNSL